MVTRLVKRGSVPTVILCFLFALGMESCWWNRAFLKPSKIPATATLGKSVDPQTGDTMLLHLVGDTYQPSFTDVHGKPIAMPFAIESAMFRSSGQELNGWMLRSTTAAPSYTMLFLHGNGGNILSEYPLVLPFLQSGFQVFIFDYSGYGLSSGKANRKDLYTDAINALKFINSQYGTSLPIVVYGQSLGGHVAALLGKVASSYSVSAIVIEAGFLSFKKIGGYTISSGFLSALLVKDGPSALDSLNSYPGPVLIIHSEADKTVPFIFGEEMFGQRNSPKDFMKIDGHHGNGPIGQGKHISDKIIDIMVRFPINE